jgi:hypothetical protein
MPTIFQQLEDAASLLQSRLSRYEAVDEGHRYSWPNFVYQDKSFRRAHLDIVDARESKKLYMMHLCIFPHVNDPAPVFGFDIIAGPNKVTGAFHDFSPVVKGHPMLNWFQDRVSGYTWSKQRELPEWARNIFSGSMVAAGNIQDSQELATVIELVVENLDFYLKEVGNATDQDYTDQQNWYCQNQKKNPHTPRVMESLGLDPVEVQEFIHTCLFPEVESAACPGPVI